MMLVCGTTYLIRPTESNDLPVVTSLWLQVTLASANEWKLLKINL